MIISLYFLISVNLDAKFHLLFVISYSIIHLRPGFWQCLNKNGHCNKVSLELCVHLRFLRLTRWDVPRSEVGLVIVSEKKIYHYLRVYWYMKDYWLLILWFINKLFWTGLFRHGLKLDAGFYTVKCDKYSPLWTHLCSTLFN